MHLNWSLLPALKYSLLSAQFGAVHTGYTMANGKIVIDYEKAEIIRQIFKEYKDGKTISELANKLTRLCIPYCEKRVNGIKV